jgi:hypothetical protein
MLVRTSTTPAASPTRPSDDRTDPWADDPWTDDRLGAWTDAVTSTNPGPAAPTEGAIGDVEIEPGPRMPRSNRDYNYFADLRQALARLHSEKEPSEPTG